MSEQSIMEIIAGLFVITVFASVLWFNHDANTRNNKDNNDVDEDEE